MVLFVVWWFLSVNSQQEVWQEGESWRDAEYVVYHIVRDQSRVPMMGGVLVPIENCEYFADCLGQEDPGAWVVSVRKAYPVPGLHPSLRPKIRPPFRRMRVIFINKVSRAKVIFDTYGPIGGTHVFAMDHVIIQCIIDAIDYHHDCPWIGRCRCERTEASCHFYRPSFRSVDNTDWPEDSDRPFIFMKEWLYKQQNKRQAADESEARITTWARKYFVSSDEESDGDTESSDSSNVSSDSDGSE